MFAYAGAVKVGGYNRQVDMSRLGGAVLIGACVVLAVRTARWPVTVAKRDEPNTELWQEVGYAVRLALQVMGQLTSRNPDLFAKKNVPWYMPNEEDQPK